MDSPFNTLTTDKGKVLYITLGCAKNEVDTDRMRALLTQGGYSETTDVHKADIALVNTCSFLVSATQESIETTLSLVEELHAGLKNIPIVMCGCVPSRYGEELEKELVEVAAFVRHDEEDGIVQVVDSLLCRPASSPCSETYPLRTLEASSAFIKISEGCDRFCSFCAIPYIRGSYYSRPLDTILKEISYLAHQGVKEFILIGQDTGVWGSDFPEKLTISHLLSRVAETVRPYGGWVRVLYLQPEGMTDELIALIRDTPEILPYIDIPIQHCSERVLSAMRRSGSKAELKALFDRLRSEIPGMVLRTTAMAGFPGESDEEAQELLDFIEDCAFDYVSVFAYSAEDGTEAADLPNQVDEKVKLERTQALLDLAERLGFSASASHVGEIVEVIIDGVDNSSGKPELIGHSWFQAPDSDGVVHIEEGEASVGDVVRVELVDSFCYELIGRIVDA